MQQNDRTLADFQPVIMGGTVIYNLRFGAPSPRDANSRYPTPAVLYALRT